MNRIVEQMVREAVQAMPLEFESHDVIAWLMKNRTPGYVVGLMSYRLNGRAFRSASVIVMEFSNPAAAEEWYRVMSNDFGSWDKNAFYRDRYGVVLKGISGWEDEEANIRRKLEKAFK